MIHDTALGMVGRRWLLLAMLLVPALVVGSATALENHDGFCAACHTQPEQEYLERSRSAATDLASAHAGAEVRCIDCHSGQGIFGRTASLRQGASDLVAYLSGNGMQPAVTTNPFGDPGCVKCHAQPSGVAELSAPVEHISSSHYHYREYTREWLVRQPDPAGSCSACHVGHSLAALSGQGYSITAATQVACEACHAALSGWVPR
jgi:hypothetical protein